MTRPKKPQATYATHLGFWGAPRDLEHETRQQITDKAAQAGFDLPEDFFKSLVSISGEYHGRLTIKDPTTRDIKNALESVAEQARSLRQTLESLDFMTRSYVELTCLVSSAPPHFMNGTRPLERELEILERTADAACDTVPQKTRPPNHAKASAVLRLRALFEGYGLPWTQTEPSAYFDYSGLAAVCLAWVFADGKRVGHWLERAQKSPP